MHYVYTARQPFLPSWRSHCLLVLQIVLGPDATYLSPFAECGKKGEHFLAEGNFAHKSQVDSSQLIPHNVPEGSSIEESKSIICAGEPVPER